MIRRISVRGLALAMFVAAAQRVTADTWQPLEQWRIDTARVAPWAPPGTRIDDTYRGREIRFERERLVGPEPIACDDATYEWIFGQAEGLFEGGLPAPAAAAAERLGLGAEPIATLRVTCSNAGFDFHRDRDGNLLLGLDNVVWSLQPVRAATTPAEIVQELLIAHFTHDMGFTPESVAPKSDFLSAGLRQRIARYFALPQSPDEVPEIDGDPFTDSQEYPNRFTLGPARTESARTVVPVHFPLIERRVDYVLATEDGRWVLDDLIDERGGSLREVLEGEDAEPFAAFLERFHAALVAGHAGEVAALVSTPFLYAGEPLDTAGVARIVPELFTAAVTRCFETAAPIAEDDRQVVFCAPYAFYFGRDGDEFRLLEFGADGEDAAAATP